MIEDKVTRFSRCSLSYMSWALLRCPLTLGFFDDIGRRRKTVRSSSPKVNAEPLRALPGAHLMLLGVAARSLRHNLEPGFSLFVVLSDERPELWCLGPKGPGS